MIKRPSKVPSSYGPVGTKLSRPAAALKCGSNWRINLAVLEPTTKKLQTARNVFWMMFTLAFSTKSMNWYFFHTHVSPVLGAAV